MRSKIVWRQAGAEIVYVPTGTRIMFRPSAEYLEPPAVGSKTAIGGVEWIGSADAPIRGLPPQKQARLMRVAGDMYFLYRAYNLRLPVEIVDGPSRVNALPDKIEIECDSAGYEHDLVELYARAALGQRDHLLATSYFQPGLPPELEGRALAFAALIAPLQTAWAWREMRLALPTVYEQEVAGLVGAMRSVLGVNEDEPVVIHGAPVRLRDYLGIFAVVYEDERNLVRLNIVSSPENNRAWDRYASCLLDFTRMEPDVELYCQIPDAALADYHVRISEEGLRHFILGAR